jgi:hypothetical protein
MRLTVRSLDSTTVKAPPDGAGALKKRAASHWQKARRVDHHTTFGCRN